MLYIVVIISFVLIFIVVNLILSNMLLKNQDIERRISEIANPGKVLLEGDNKTFRNKLTDSMSDFLEKVVYRNSKEYRHEKIQKKLDNAGISKSITPILYISNLIIFSIIAFMSSFIIVYIITLDIIKSGLFALLAIFIYQYFQNFFLLRKITWRKNKMVRDLPYTLDLILVSVEAGLSFDGAISKVVDNISGPISEEFAKMLKEIRMGIDRKTAMKNMSTRCGIKEMSTLNTSIIQADELGVSISKVIRIQAITLREDRKQKAREKAMKAPVKILLPLILFVFPTIFIVILGPSVIKIMEIFN